MKKSAAITFLLLLVWSTLAPWAAALQPPAPCAPVIEQKSSCCCGPAGECPCAVGEQDSAPAPQLPAPEHRAIAQVPMVAELDRWFLPSPACSFLPFPGAEGADLSFAVTPPVRVMYCVFRL